MTFPQKADCIGISVDCSMSSFFSTGCCRHGIRGEVGALPAAEDVCQLSQQPLENFHQDAGAESREPFAFIMPEIACAVGNRIL